MKRIALYIFGFLMIGCTSDDVTNRVDLPEIETSPSGLKIKQVEGDNITQYFYHKNGFIDSISFIGENIIAEKIIYNNTNQIIEKRYASKKASDTNFSIYNSTYFAYNNKKQIIHFKT